MNFCFLTNFTNYSNYIHKIGLKLIWSDRTFLPKIPIESNQFRKCLKLWKIKSIFFIIWFYLILFCFFKSRWLAVLQCESRTRMKLSCAPINYTALFRLFKGQGRNGQKCRMNHNTPTVFTQPIFSIMENEKSNGCCLQFTIVMIW